MRKIALFTLVSLFAAATLPAQASLADRKSDQAVETPAKPAPYSGQVVIRGEVQPESHG